jgi:hypothetical protein
VPPHLGTGWRVGYNIEWRNDVCFAQWHKASGPASYREHYLCLCTDKEMPPVTNVKDIEDYFVYDDLTLEILPKYKEGTEAFKKADYMRKISDLNHKKLIRMREKVVKDIERNGPYEKHEKLLPPFYSMLFQLKLL